MPKVQRLHAEAACGQGGRQQGDGLQCGVWQERAGILYSNMLPECDGIRTGTDDDGGKEMKWIVIGLIVLVGLFDYALIVACSHLEDREQYYQEKHLKERRHE